MGGVLGRDASGRAHLGRGAGSRPALLRAVLHRFSLLAVIAVGLVVLSGTVNAFANLAAASDLWDTDYGRIITAKIALLAAALVLAARHRWIVPRRIEREVHRSGAVRSFERTSALEALVLAAAVGLAAGLVALVPGRTLALAARGPVTQEQHAGIYTVQLFLDPSRAGTNQVHLTFVNPQGLAAAEVTNIDVAVKATHKAREPVMVRLISPGHFVGDVSLPAGDSQLSISKRGGTASTTFTVHLRGA